MTFGMLALFLSSCTLLSSLIYCCYINVRPYSEFLKRVSLGNNEDSFSIIPTGIESVTCSGGCLTLSDL